MEEKTSTLRHYAIGVLKLNYTAAGYTDLIKIAQEWSKDPNFYELIVRGVSDKNFGIQFVYISQPGEYPASEQPFRKYWNELNEKFGDDLYATDYESGTYIEDQNSSLRRKLKSNIILMKEFKF